MLSLVSCMGYSAVTSNIAKDFLVQAIHPGFWKSNILWRTDLGEFQYSVLAGRALIALARSGRSEFEEIAQRIAASPKFAGFQYGLEGALVDAHFHKHLVASNGWDSYLKMDSEEIMRAFPEWKKTPTGSNWFNWFLEKENIVLPSQSTQQP